MIATYSGSHLQGIVLFIAIPMCTVLLIYKLVHISSTWMIVALTAGMIASFTTHGLACHHVHNWQRGNCNELAIWLVDLVPRLMHFDDAKLLIERLQN